MKKITKEKAERIYQQVARKNNTTVEDVKKEIKRAMVIGMCNQDPEVQRKWREIPRDHDVLTPEELLIFLSMQVKQM